MQTIQTTPAPAALRALVRDVSRLSDDALVELVGLADAAGADDVLDAASAELVGRLGGTEEF